MDMGFNRGRDSSFNGTTTTGILDDCAIMDMVYQKGMIHPFVPTMVRGTAISFGVEGYAYDARLAEDIGIFKTTVSDGVIDPKNFSESVMERSSTPDGGYQIIPPHGFALGRTVETFNIPSDVIAICIGKSTYARVGLIVNVTPINPGFSGQVVVEISNTTNYPVKVYIGEGICQFLFFRGVRTPSQLYEGRYNGQMGLVVPPKISETDTQ